MNICVCIKQVPDTNEIKVDPVTHTLVRKGVPSIVNPFDTYAQEVGVRLKEKLGGKVVHARGPGLLRRRHPALLRGQHSGRRAPHLDPRAYERDASLHHPACRQGLAARRTGESRAGVGAEHHRRQGGLQTRGRRLGAALRTVGAVTCRDGNPQAL